MAAIASGGGENTAFPVGSGSRVSSQKSAEALRGFGGLSSIGIGGTDRDAGAASGTLKESADRGVQPAAGFRNQIFHIEKCMDHGVELQFFHSDSRIPEFLRVKPPLIPKGTEFGGYDERFRKP